MPTADELIAHNRTEEEVCRLIGADGLIFQDLDALVDCARRGNRHIKEFEQSCFSGEYVTGDVSESYLREIGILRADDVKADRQRDDDSLRDLFSTATGVSLDV
jgi:amidophosphoribosyltransferase